MEAEVRAIIASEVAEPDPVDDFGARVMRAQARFANLKPTARRASDELIAERRLEAWRDEVESNDWLREHGDKRF